VTVEPAGPEAGGWALAPPPEADGEARFLTVTYIYLSIYIYIYSRMYNTGIDIVGCIIQV
jgi:hypothetical protein